MFSSSMFSPASVLQEMDAALLHMAQKTPLSAVLEELGKKATSDRQAGCFSRMASLCRRRAPPDVASESEAQLLDDLIQGRHTSQQALGRSCSCVNQALSQRQVRDNAAFPPRPTESCVPESSDDATADVLNTDLSEEATLRRQALALLRGSRHRPNSGAAACDALYSSIVDQESRLSRLSEDAMLLKDSSCKVQWREHDDPEISMAEDSGEEQAAEEVEEQAAEEVEEQLSQGEQQQIREKEQLQKFQEKFDRMIAGCRD